MEILKLEALPNLEIKVIPIEAYEFLIPTRDAAEAFGVNPDRLLGLRDDADELVEGVHFVKGETVIDRLKEASPDMKIKACIAQPKQTLWTKTGIVRLGFLIHSARAVVFRQWAEALILPQLSAKPLDEIPDTEDLGLMKQVAKMYTAICRVRDEKLRNELSYSLNKIIAWKLPKKLT